MAARIAFMTLPVFLSLWLLVSVEAVKIPTNKNNIVDKANAQPVGTMHTIALLIPLTSHTTSLTLRAYTPAHKQDHPHMYIPFRL